MIDVEPAMVDPGLVFKTHPFKVKQAPERHNMNWNIGTKTGQIF